MDGYLTYIIGQPGSGKTSLVHALLDGLAPVSVEDRPFAHIVWGNDVVELGARRPGGFSGTDALSMSVQPRVVEWLQTEAPAYVLGEGDRLATGSFFTDVVQAGWQLRIIRLTVSSAVAEARRQARAAELGTTPQNPAWLKGRITKLRKLADDWLPYILEVNADAPLATVVSQVRAAEDPVLARLEALIPSTA